MSFKTRFSFAAALTFMLALGCAGGARALVGVSITIAPPALPVYVQPPVPAPGYLWTPGYWAFSESDNDYYWVPGTWVAPPQVGFLWTPGYWAASGGGFVWNAGYWGPEVGFYGGVNYGFGYVGTGFVGGHWDNGQYFYNRAAANVSDTHITNVYNTTVVNNTVSNVSYNGGSGGTTARPTAHEVAVAHESHVAPTPAQVQQQHAASTNRQLFASVNHGRPAIAATQKAGAMSGPGVVSARNAAQVPRNEPQPPADRAPAPQRNEAHPAPAPSAPRPKAAPPGARPDAAPNRRTAPPRPGEGAAPDRPAQHPAPPENAAASRSAQSHREAPRPDRPPESREHEPKAGRPEGGA